MATTKIKEKGKENCDFYERSVSVLGYGCYKTSDNQLLQKVGLDHSQRGLKESENNYRWL